MSVHTIKIHSAYENINDYDKNQRDENIFFKNFIWESRKNVPRKKASDNDCSDWRHPNLILWKLLECYGNMCETWLYAQNCL